MTPSRHSAVLIVAIAAIALGLGITRLYPEPAWYPVRAEVTRISTSFTRDHRIQVVGLRTSTGIGEARFTDLLVTCEVGDLVDAEQSGVAIRRVPSTCF